MNDQHDNSITDREMLLRMINRDEGANMAKHYNVRVIVEEVTEAVPDTPLSGGRMTPGSPRRIRELVTFSAQHENVNYAITAGMKALSNARPGALDEPDPTTMSGYLSSHGVKPRMIKDAPQA